MAIHWRRLDEGRYGITLRELTAKIRKLLPGQLWRHDTAGDLPGLDGKIDARALRSITSANRGRKGFTYTHKPMTPRNQELVQEANDNGFTISLSADSPAQADELKKLGVGPVVTVLPAKQMENFKTADGHTVVICPAITHDGVTCKSCRLCAWSEREAIIGFPAHGARKYQVIVPMPYPAAGAELLPILQ